jgi:glycosyltransferase involved in cell wall biosynthesis
MLSIIVIGRNEAENLPKLHTSLGPLLQAVPCETLYVDSASTDASADIARALFDLTIVLEPSPHLNASAGRYVGVLHAGGDWVLFLDGDMQLVEACVPVLSRHIAESDPSVGLVGPNLHYYVEGHTRTWVPPENGRGVVLHFGGAVMLSMQALRRENWDPRLYSNEEAELYARLREHGDTVRGMDVPFIGHFTEHQSFYERLRGNFVCKGSYLGKKFYGVGQVLRARVEAKRLAGYAAWVPEPFVLWGSIVAAPVCAWLAHWSIGLVLVLLATAYVAVRRKSVRNVLTYLSFLPQAIHGYGRLDSTWKPQVAASYHREG